MPETLAELAASVSEEEKAEIARLVEPHLARSRRLVPMSELFSSDPPKGFCQLVITIHTDKQGNLIDAWMSRE